MTIMHRLARLLAACSIALAACSGSDAPPPPPPTASLKILNNTSESITTVYIAAATASSWGANQISSWIAPGTSRTIASIAPGTYDLRVEGSGGGWAEEYDVVFTAGQTYTWTLSDTATGTLVVANSSSYTVGYLYVAPYPNGYSYANWGPNQLGAYTISPGYQFTLNNVPAGYWDLKAVSVGSAYSWTRYDELIDANVTHTWTLY